MEREGKRKAFTLNSSVSSDCAAEGMADKDESAGHRSSTNAQNIARKSICSAGKR